MDLSKLSVIQLAAILGAAGTIIGAVLTVDSRYVKQSELADVKKELKVSLDKLHQQILENEQLKEDLGNNATAAKVLSERNKAELAEIRARLSREVYKTIKIAPVQAEIKPVPE